MKCDVIRPELVHRAEDAGDDVTLVGVWDELSRRERRFPGLGVTRVFQTWYVMLHRPEYRT